MDGAREGQGSRYTRERERDRPAVENERRVKRESGADLVGPVVVARQVNLAQRLLDGVTVVPTREHPFALLVRHAEERSAPLRS